jgi:hypothetical protein
MLKKLIPGPVLCPVLATLTIRREFCIRKMKLETYTKRDFILPDDNFLNNTEYDFWLPLFLADLSPRAVEKLEKRSCPVTNWYLDLTLLFSAKVEEYNRAVSARVTQKNPPHSPIVTVAQYTSFNTTIGVDTDDGIHPNESGKKKMATPCYNAIYFMLLKNPYKQYISITR